MNINLDFNYKSIKPFIFICFHFGILALVFSLIVHRLSQTRKDALIGSLSLITIRLTVDARPTATLIEFSNMEEVKLIGMWLSPYSYRVIWALKLKGIAYEYIEEDLSNKSPLLLHSNPVQKKIPVLIHGGKPICESSVILEYIEEIWPQNSLLPSDPYERAIARFWIKFADDKSPSISNIYRTSGEEQEKAVKDSLEMLKTIEEHGLVGEKKFFGGDKISMVDMAFGAVAHWLGVIEDVAGLKIFEQHKFPRLNSWIQNFKEVPIIKENLPDRDKMLALLKRRREMLLASE
ncbi:hypothetical protein CRYUN_Cryun36dG0045400 [Craigia yunnanensis]